MCRDVQYAGVCAEFCSADSELIPAEWKRQACKWQDADGLTGCEIFYTRCRDNGDADWCAYACIDATNGNTSYLDS